MKIKNLKSNRKSISKLSAYVLASTLAATTLIGCRTKVSRDSNTDKNRAMLSIGNECFVVDIDAYTRWDDSNIQLELTDGTSLNVHPMALTLFNSKSPVMSQIQELTLNNDNLKTR